jgi:ubiquitin C-terminal hydrolase
MISALACPGELSTEFAGVLQKLWTNPTDERYGGGEYHPSGVVPTVCNPSTFKKHLGSLAPKYKGFEQQDAQEFLRFFLDELHNELNR